MERVESQTFHLGVDNSVDIYSRAKRLAFTRHAVNRSFIRSINSTRPPFEVYELIFSSDEEKDTFERGAITGCFWYSGSPPSFGSHLIVAVGDSVFAGIMHFNSIEFIRLYKGLDPQWQHTFFCQALNILVLQNGKQDPLYWDGYLNKPMRPVQESEFGRENVMPRGNLMVFAHGRIFLATELDTVLVSDSIYSQGFEIAQREAVLSFNESTNITDGGSFGSPTDLGPITGTVVIPKSREINGHGDVIILCKDGAWSISIGGVPRNQWTNGDIQKIVFLGQGCASNESIVNFNNDLLYRTIDNDIASINANIAAYQQFQSFVSISDPIREYLNFDTDSSDIRFTEAIAFRDRLFMSVAIEKNPSALGGMHRYAKGVVVACNQRTEAGNRMTWEGLWTGPRPAAMVTANIGYNRTGIFLSHDSDGINRIYRLSNHQNGDDYTSEGNRKIFSFFSANNIFFDEEVTLPILKKKLEKVEYLLKDSNGTVSASYSPDFTNKEFKLSFPKVTKDGCGLGSFYSVSHDLCKDRRRDNKKDPRHSFTFDFFFEMEGIVNFAKITFRSTMNEDDATTVPDKCSYSINEGFSLCKDDCDVVDRFKFFSYTF